jgi:hypothetical protein
MYPPSPPPLSPPTLRYENLLPQISRINQRAIVKYHPEHHCTNYSAIFRLLRFQFTLSRGHVTERYFSRLFKEPFSFSLLL